jgi:hypothetical protein
LLKTSPRSRSAFRLPTLRRFIASVSLEHAQRHSPSPPQRRLGPPRLKPVDAHLDCPPQACAGFSDATCAGVPAGQILTIVSDDKSYGSSFNGRTISNMDFCGG